MLCINVSINIFISKAKEEITLNRLKAWKIGSTWLFIVDCFYAYIYSGARVIGRFESWVNNVVVLPWGIDTVSMYEM